MQDAGCRMQDAGRRSDGGREKKNKIKIKIRIRTPRGGGDAGCGEIGVRRSEFGDRSSEIGVRSSEFGDGSSEM
jgi:hypothetical protein